jgi:KDO2-lipid IV(A) lauroyltransferase
MWKAGYYIFSGINRVLALLPLGVLYLFSDALFLLLYYFPSYRRHVVRENLLNSFPDKSPEEIIRIEKEFYRHLADLFIETLKLPGMRNKELMKRVRLTNPELIKNLYESGKDIAMVYSHYNNWEWLSTCTSLYTDYRCVGVYKPIQNKIVNKFLNDQRTRNNADLAPMQMIVRKIVENRKKGIRGIYGFMSDQTPAPTLIEYYTGFLNQETPVFLGLEKIASKYNMAVVFIDFLKIKRGFYEMTYEVLFETTSGLPRYMITDTHVKRLEKMILARPEHWLWTHRRWKYKKETANG